MQLELFCTVPQELTRLPVWENLTEEQQAALVALLTRLMSKTIQHQPESEPDEQR
jgi:phenylpyruvate tautomerase PptA (4-oxalocrotonate tautomerase family)